MVQELKKNYRDLKSLWIVNKPDISYKVNEEKLIRGTNGIEEGAIFCTENGYLTKPIIILTSHNLRSFYPFSILTKI